MAARTVLRGIGVSTGAVVGPVAVVEGQVGVDKHEAPCADPELVRDALNQVAEGYRSRAGQANSDTAREVLAATAALAGDRALAKAVDKQLAQGAGATAAVYEAVEVYAAKFRQLGGTMAQRVSDLYDIRDRAIAHLRGLPEPGLPPLTRPAILVAKDLAPADTATLDPELVLGIVTEEGGPTSHTAILAAQLGIPAVVQAKGIKALLADAPLISLNAHTGEVVISPTEVDVRALQDGERRRLAAFTAASGSRAPVALMANIGSVRDASAAPGADGCGLFRTEFLFLDRDCAPGLQEQTETYTRVLRAFGPRRVVVRTLDAGADKPLRFADLGAEPNPALGRRGIRLAQAREDLLDVQLEALARASRAVPGSQLWVMAPMVATVEETRWFVERARGYGLADVGVMIETPAAALTAAQILEAADFASIGTNDLAQYTMAADRMAGELAPLLSPWQPAVLTMIREACRGAETHAKPIGVCGEAAGDPLMALVLAGLGATSLSMAPVRIPAVRAALHAHGLQACREMARAALSAPTADLSQSAAADLFATGEHSR
ncbi:phosphoenolpyruvate--protein phosphotransferase [Corynebacterium sp. Q4381]|uniref:phosphoenolpyruvate--protein phosphotransferase n=1 Tax=Corynebacterium sp. Marseille-Q4381 TaxID=3121597 RepID=UPI002FE61A4D